MPPKKKNGKCPASKGSGEKMDMLKQKAASNKNGKGKRADYWRRGEGVGGTPPRAKRAGGSLGVSAVLNRKHAITFGRPS